METKRTRFAPRPGKSFKYIFSLITVRGKIPSWPTLPSNTLLLSFLLRRGTAPLKPRAPMGQALSDLLPLL